MLKPPILATATVHDGIYRAIARESVAYDDLKAQISPANDAAFDRELVQLLRMGVITIKSGLYVIRGGA